MTGSKGQVLVTGGAGYIGSVLTGLLLQLGFRVRVLDKLTFGGTSLLGYLDNPNFELMSGDVCSSADVKRSLTDIQSVVHLAAIVGDPACKASPKLATEVNKTGAELVCDAAMKAGIRRFIFSSTCSNYGRMSDPNGFVDENSQLKPVSLYAELKVSFENYLLSQNRPGFEPVCLRFATAYGLSPRPRFDLTVNEFTRELALGNKLEVFGEQFWRPYCHTADISRAVVKALEAKGEIVSHTPFNVGDTDENYQKKTLVELILAELPDRAALVSYVHRDEDPRDYRVNFQRIKEKLGFGITRRVPDGIREYIQAIQSGLIVNPQDPLYRNL
ncbi:MAG TPA: NAD(P)-dependent oxidoreductase [candidate division Zixibacteria bacterium]|nr:NAD(P)-dependent oxidoreductase [candidate division Zixibacteria bacterium]